MIEDIENPEIRVPFTFTEDGDVLYVEQDSDTDIQQCVWSLLSYEPGQFLANPAFGVADQTFSKGGVDIDRLQRIIAEWDDRAQEIIEDNSFWFETLVQTITIRRDTDS